MGTGNHKSSSRVKNHCIFCQLYHVHLEDLSLGLVVATVSGGEDVIELRGVLGEKEVTGEH